MLEGVARGGEVLFVEGQGSLLHPAYSGVTLGLIHGSRAARLRALPPWPARRSSTGTSGSRSRRSRELVALHERDQPAAAAGEGRTAIALNTRQLDDDAARGGDRETEAETGLPADDPVRFGAATELALFECSDASCYRPSRTRGSGLSPRRGRLRRTDGAIEEGLRRLRPAGRSRSARPASADNITWGVNDDAGKYEQGDGPFWTTLLASA